jgi:hypothetical protein
MSEVGPDFWAKSDQIDAMIRDIKSGLAHGPRLPDAIRALVAERNRLRAAVDAALALHGRSRIEGWCNGCTDRYPCATVRALAPVADPDPHTTSDEEQT